MSKVNQIQNALKEIDGGKFQKLADCYIHKKGYQNINPIGSVVGADKVRTGTPDSYARQKNGKLIFAEYTTEQTGLEKKLQGDLDKCLDVNKTGIPLDQIEEIVFCHNSLPKLTNEQTLYDTCEQNGIKLQIFGLGELSFDLYQKYPALAKDFLGISIDTGQILEPDDFITIMGKNNISTPLDTNFYCREIELQEALEKVESNDLVILSGSAGIGKSRLALEIIENYKKSHSGFELRVIYNKGQNLFEDIRSYFSSSGDFLILVDDANRITQFDYFVDLLQNQRTDQNIKVIATVRDYARDKIIQSACPLTNVSELIIKPMKPEEIKGFIKKQYQINNQIYLDRISDIAGGNPRLAIMAAIVAVKANNIESIRDVSVLYDEYFSSISNDLKKLQDKEILKVIGVISFFRTIDRSHLETMELIQNVFGISSETLWQSIEYLHRIEVVDLYEKEVAKITDQVFSTYLFYLCFFKEKDLKFSLLLENFFPSQVGKIRDAIYPCLNSFNFNEIEKILEPEVRIKWDECINKNNTSDLHELIRTFWFLLQSNVLVYVRDNIALIKKQDMDIDSICWDSRNVAFNDHPFLEILSLFKQANDENTFKIVLDLVLNYIEKVPQATPQFISLLTKRFGFNPNSHRNGYTLQNILIEALWNKTEDGGDEFFSRLFLTVSSKYLPTEYDYDESSKMTITIHRIKLLGAEPIFNLRASIWNGIFKLYKNQNLRKYILDVIKSYCEFGYRLSENDIVEKDTEHLVSFIQEELNTNDFFECLIVQNYQRMLKRRNITSATEIADKFHSEMYNLYKVLSFDYSDADVNSVSEFDEIKKEKIISYTMTFDIIDYQKFIKQSQEILTFLDNNHEVEQVRKTISQVFTCLSDKDKHLFKRVIQEYLITGDLLEIQQPIILVKKLIKSCGTEQSLQILEKHEYNSKNHWLFAFYQCLTNEDINKKTVLELHSLYKKAEASEFPHHLDYLLNYMDSDATIITTIVGLVIEKTKEDKTFGSSLDMLFNPYSEINKRILEIFTGNLTLLKEAYLLNSKLKQRSDFNGSTLNRILSADPDFILDIIDHIYSNDQWPDRYSDTKDYSFLWEHDNRKSIIMTAINDILKRKLKESYIPGSYLERLFCIGGGNNKCTDEVILAQDKFLENVINESAINIDLMKLIFGIISNFTPERKKKFIEIFLKTNKNHKDFIVLPIEPSSGSWSGSAVPYYQAKVDFWISLLPLCDSVELLSHKLSIEKHIESWREKVEREKKSDFMDEYE